MLRIAFAGLGGAVRNLHLPAIARVPEAEPVAGCDTSADARADFARATGLPVHETLDALLDHARPELVVVATPIDSHARLSIQALEAGAHVLCEKPLAPTLAEADRMLAAADRSGRVLAVHHGFREQPIFRALLERIGSPAAGRLSFCQVWQLVDLPPWDEPAQWRAERPDMALLEGGIHLVDLLIGLFGEPPAAVYARRSSGVARRGDTDAIAVLTVEFSEGRLGHVLIDRLCRAADRYLEVRADCERESLRASWGGRALLSIGKERARRAGVHLELAAGGIAWIERGARRRTIARDPRRPGVAGTAALLERLVAAIVDGTEPPSSGREARAALEVVEAAYRSAASGERLALPGPAGGLLKQTV